MKPKAVYNHYMSFFMLKKLPKENKKFQKASAHEKALIYNQKQYHVVITPINNPSKCIISFIN